MLASSIMMGLGVFRFGMEQGAYNLLARSAPYRWAKLDRIGQEPARQFLGADTQSLTIEGVIYPHYKGGLRQIELMQVAGEKGQPLMLVDGLGFIWRRWVIMRIDHQRTHFLPGGEPRKITFQLTLESYGQDAQLLDDGLEALQDASSPEDVLEAAWQTITR